MQALLKGSVDSGGQLGPVLSVPSHTLGSLTPSRTPHCPHLCLGTSGKVSQTRNCSLCPRVNEHRPWAPVFTLALCMRSHMQSLCTRMAWELGLILPLGCVGVAAGLRELVHPAKPSLGSCQPVPFAQRQLDVLVIHVLREGTVGPWSCSPRG